MQGNIEVGKDMTIGTIAHCTTLLGYRQDELATTFISQ